MKSKISKIGIAYAMIAITFTTKCANEDEADTTSEIVIPNIVKTDSQLRDEAYRADPIYGEIKNLEDYWLAFKTIGETQYGYDFGDQEVKIFTDLTIANSDSDRDDAAGIAYGSCKEGVINIAINADYWAEYSFNRKLILMWHELGHDVLNAAHIEGERAIMNTPLPDEYDLNIFKKEEADLFNGNDLVFFDCDDPYFN
jgi:hypothetical protein